MFFRSELVMTVRYFEEIYKDGFLNIADFNTMQVKLWQVSSPVHQIEEETYMAEKGRTGLV